MRVLLALSAALLLLTVGPGATAGTSTTPPRNGLIAVYGEDGLYLVDPVAGSALSVPNVVEAADAAWSPDGTRLAASFWSPEDETPGIYTMKPDGSERTLVVRDGVSPTWSPDGHWLAFSREDFSGEPAPADQLVVIAADGTDERVLLPPAGGAPASISTPAWSPDGELVAFVGDGGRIGLVSPDGESSGVFDVDATRTSLSWSPDSSRLAFESNRREKGETQTVVVVLDLATGKETVLPGEQNGAQAPAWSPEGDQIAFISMKLRPTQRTTTSHSCGGEAYDTRLWSMRPDGTKAHQVVEAAVYGRPSWGRAS